MINANKNIKCKDGDGDGTLDTWHIKAEKEIGGNFEIGCLTIDDMAKIAAAKAAITIIKKGCNKIPVIDANGSNFYASS